MQKILALDIGDRWTGTALSDNAGITAKPYKTIATEILSTFIQQTLNEYAIETVVVGYPLTLRATQSEQTKTIIRMKEKLAKLFPLLEWKLWDERLTSKQAAQLKQPRTKEEKLHNHSVAAAFILQSYLDYRKNVPQTQ